jgi:hypothetical protein
MSEGGLRRWECRCGRTPILLAIQGKDGPYDKD